MGIERFRIGDLLLDCGDQEVSRDGLVIALPHLSFELLLVLARHAPNLISAEALESEVWAGLIVSPGTITKHIALLREALGDDAEHPKYISVVRGQGYRLMAPVSRVGSETRSPAGIAAGICKYGRPGLLTASILAVMVSLAVFLSFQLETDTDAGTASDKAQSSDEAVSGKAISSPDIPDLSIAVLPFVTLGESTADSQDLAGYRPRAKQAALTALQFDPNLPEALSVIAALHWINGDFEQARAQFEHALRRPVADSNVRLWAGIVLDSVGYTAQACALYQKAYQLDPLNQNLIGYLARSLARMGEPAQALSLQQSQIDTRWKDAGLGIIWLEKGDFNQARQLLSDFQMPYGILPARYVDLAGHRHC